MENELVDLDKIEAGKIYRDVLSDRLVLVSRVDVSKSVIRTVHHVTGVFYNPVTGTDVVFETTRKRLIKWKD